MNRTSTRQFAVFETRHPARGTLGIHRHAAPYLALVMEGSYEEFSVDGVWTCEPGESPSVAPSGTGAHALRKGLTLEQVERILGPAIATTETREGSLVVLNRTYRRGTETIVARFVDDVLVRYSISSD